MLAFSALIAGSFSLGGQIANDIDPAALNAVRFVDRGGGGLRSAEPAGRASARGASRRPGDTSCSAAFTRSIS
jgi:hypothetical protein